MWSPPFSIPSIALCLAYAATQCLAHGSGGPSQGSAHRGLIGYGISMFEPTCAHACRRVLADSPLNCSTILSSTGHHDRRHGHVEAFETSPECFASSRPFLLSLAACIRQRCVDHHGHAMELWRLEQFWVAEAVGGGHRPGDEDISFYQAALAQVEGKVFTYFVEKGHELHEPGGSVSDEDYGAYKTYLDDFGRVETQHSTFGLALLFVMLALPPATSLLHHLIAAASPAAERFLLGHIFYPALFGRRHLTGLPWNIGLVPLRGQALLLLFILLLNVGFSVATYEGSMPNANYSSAANAFWAYTSNRAGVLSFANLPVIFLYSGRNNPLMRLSSWEHDTFLLLHRWVAYICIAQATLHSGIKLIMHIPVLSEMLAKPYWIVGIMAVGVFILIFMTSILPIRRRWYQWFLDIHIVFAVVGLVGCYYHIYLEFGHKWGYENWVLLAIFVWIAERLVRLVRLASNGVQEATVAPVDHEYMEVNIEGKPLVGTAYLSFPSLGWRPWENHPFSVAGQSTSNSASYQPADQHDSASDTMFEVGSDSDVDEADSLDMQLQPMEREDLCEKDDKATSSQSGNRMLELPKRDGAGMLSPADGGPEPTEENRLLNADAEAMDTHAEETEKLPLRARHGAAITGGSRFLIRRQAGLTKRLFNSTGLQKVLVEGPYTSASSNIKLCMATPQLVCIVGGSGISAVLPLLHARMSSSAVGRTTLYWSCRSEGLVQASGIREAAGGSGVDVNILVGQRWEVQHVVRDEVELAQGELTIISCGPAGMADDVRWAVVQANRRGTRGVVRLVEDCFSW